MTILEFVIFEIQFQVIQQYLKYSSKVFSNIIERLFFLLLQYFYQKMKLILVFLFALTLCASQITPCTVCSKIAKCPKELFSDPYVDPIYNDLVGRVKARGYPRELTKEGSQRQARYTFIWATQSYRANLDLNTLQFTITLLSKLESTLTTQQKLGLRSQSTKKPSSDSYSIGRIKNQIDSDIRAKYFAGENVVITQQTATEKGYRVVYKRADNSLKAFEVTIEKKNENVIVTYQTSTQTATKNSQSGNQSWGCQKQNDNIMKGKNTEKLGGYSSITEPLKNSEVARVISYLYEQLGGLLSFASLSSAQSQVVAGYNYRLKFRFDHFSSAVYVIVVYKDLSGAYSITSATFDKVPQSISFGKALSPDQTSRLLYLSSVSQKIMQRWPSVLTSDSVLDQIFVNLPYYQFVYRNSAYSEIAVNFSFDIVTKQLSFFSNVSLQQIQYKLRQSKTATKPQSIRILNCLQQQGNVCIQCAFKYYLNGGSCFPVAPQCKDYDYSQNQCIQCYPGFYLDLKNVCQTSNFLCQQSDRRGYCLSCFREYSLTKSGLCVFTAAQGDGFILADQQANPLCSIFKRGKCTSCTKGCYLNTAGICKIPDENCQDYDKINQVCRVCMDKYVLSQNAKKCVYGERY